MISHARSPTHDLPRTISHAVTEFDYRLEAELLRQAASNLMPHFPKLVVPLPIDAQHPFNTVRSPTGGLATLCTERCLVMERLKGTSLLSAQRKQLERAAKASNTTTEQLRREMEAKFKAGQMHKSLLPSAFVIELYSQVRERARRATYICVCICTHAKLGVLSSLSLSLSLSLLLFSLARLASLSRCIFHQVLSASIAFRNVGYALQGKPTIQAQPPLNAPRLIDLLFDVHGHQVLPAFCIFTLPITLLRYFCFPSLLLTTLTRLLAPFPLPFERARLPAPSRWFLQR
jgi:hypothetical protein